MPDDNGIPAESDDNEVLDKLDALLRKHQGKPATVTGADDVAVTLPVLTQIVDAAPEQSSPPVLNKIPTLTEAIPLPPAAPSPQAELRQLLDAALLEAKIELDNTAREALIHALEWRLKNL